MYKGEYTSSSHPVKKGESETEEKSEEGRDRQRGGTDERGRDKRGDPHTNREEQPTHMSFRAALSANTAEREPCEVNIAA